MWLDGTAVALWWKADAGLPECSSFTAFEQALDVLLPELGHFKPAQAGPDRIAQLVRDLEEQGLKPAPIRRYLSPLGQIFKLAVRRGHIRVLTITSAPYILGTARHEPQHDRRDA